MTLIWLHQFVAGEESNYRRVIACNFCVEKNGGEGAFFPPPFFRLVKGSAGECCGNLPALECVLTRSYSSAYFFCPPNKRVLFFHSVVTQLRHFFFFIQTMGEEKGKGVSPAQMFASLRAQLSMEMVSSLLATSYTIENNQCETR